MLSSSFFSSLVVYEIESYACVQHVESHPLLWPRWIGGREVKLSEDVNKSDDVHPALPVHLRGQFEGELQNPEMLLASAEGSAQLLDDCQNLWTLGDLRAVARHS